MPRGQGRLLPGLFAFLFHTAGCLYELTPEPCTGRAPECASTPDASSPEPNPGPSKEEEGGREMRSESSLRFLSISEGGRYPDPVGLQVEAPTGTAYVVYASDEAELGIATERSSAWALTVTFGAAGERRITARAFDEGGRQLGEAEARIFVEVVEVLATLRFLSPAEPNRPYVNGIWFKTVATGPIVRVRYSADGYVFGESSEPDFALFYTFLRLGERRILAEGLDSTGAVRANAELVIEVIDPNAPPPTREGKAQAILMEHDAGNVVLWDEQFGGRMDGADALSNIRDTARGQGARRSVHGTAPGGTVLLTLALLDGIIALEQKGFRFFVTSVAGGSHSPTSLHYSGRAFDVDEVNGVLVRGDSALARSFMDACSELGAIEVFGPSNDPNGHFDHIHCAW